MGTPAPTPAPTPTTPAPTPGPTPGMCKAWCAGNAAPWPKKCGWAKCNGCSECSAPATSETTTTSAVATSPPGLCKRWCGRTQHLGRKSVGGKNAAVAPSALVGSEESAPETILIQALETFLFES